MYADVNLLLAAKQDGGWGSALAPKVPSNFQSLPLPSLSLCE